MDLVFLVLSVLDGGHKQLRLVREQKSVRSEPTIAGHQNGVQHGLVEEAIAHPLGDDDIHLKQDTVDKLFEW